MSGSHVLICIYFSKPEQISNVLKFLNKLDYNKKNIYLNFFINVKNNSFFGKLYEYKGRYDEEYLSIKIKTNDNKEIYQYDVNFIKLFDYFFHWNAEFCLIKNNILKHFIEFLNETSDEYEALQKFIITPMIVKDKSYWSNFWGDIDETGFYVRSEDYLEIICKKHIGCFNVPYIYGIYFASLETILYIKKQFESRYEKKHPDDDMNFCYNLRNHNVLMILDNKHDYGYYLEDKIEKYNFNTSYTTLNIKLEDYLTKENDWLNKYIDSNFIEALRNNNFEEIVKEVTNDVYMFPFVTEEFCQEIIKKSEESKLWNDVKNYSTDDINLFQLKLEKVWKKMVFNLISKLVSYCYINYQTVDINISFIARYTYQKELDPCYDSSTYTINIALNDDFKGGGYEFIRQNYKHVNVPIGYATIYPGKLTHYHRELPITGGKRYMLVSFVL